MVESYHFAACGGEKICKVAVSSFVPAVFSNGDQVGSIGFGCIRSFGLVSLLPGVLPRYLLSNPTQPQDCMPWSHVETRRTTNYEGGMVH